MAEQPPAQSEPDIPGFPGKFAAQSEHDPMPQSGAHPDRIPCSCDRWPTLHWRGPTCSAQSTENEAQRIHNQTCADCRKAFPVSTENEARRQEVFAEVPGGQHADHIHLQKRTPTVPLEEVIEECDRNADSQEPFLAAVFYDAATYLRRLSDTEAKLEEQREMAYRWAKAYKEAEAKLDKAEEEIEHLEHGLEAVIEWAQAALTRSNGKGAE